MALVKLKKTLVGEKTDLLKEKPPSLAAVVEESMQFMQQKRGFLRPSSLWGCDRRCVFYMGRSPETPQQHDYRMRRILDEGTAVHSVVQGYIADHPEYWFAPESRVSAVVSGVTIRGSCDGVLIRRSDGYRFAIEIKTKKHDLFVKLAKPDPDHVRQASLYAKIHRVWWVTILYWDKDEQYLKEFPVSFDQARWEEIEARVATLKALADRAMGQDHTWTNIDKNKLPKFDVKSCDPKFCPFTTFCEHCGGDPGSVPSRRW